MTPKQEKQEQLRLEKFFRHLRATFPEPPKGWYEAAKPPGSATRTSGRVGPRDDD